MNQKTHYSKANGLKTKNMVLDAINKEMEKCKKAVGSMIHFKKKIFDTNYNMKKDGS